MCVCMCLQRWTQWNETERIDAAAAAESIGEPKNGANGGSNGQTLI